MAKAVEMTIGISGVAVWINYNQANLRIQSVEWTIPTSGTSIRARIWDSGNLVYDRTYGQGSGSETVPGNWKMVETPEGLDLPPNITYAFTGQSIGQ